MRESTQLGKILEFVYRADIVRKLPAINDESFLYDAIMRLAHDFDWDVDLAVKFMEQVYQDWDIDPTIRAFNEEEFFEEFTGGVLGSTNSSPETLQKLLGFSTNYKKTNELNEPSL